MDPYYRSLDGFLVLAEKEFSQSGHMFAKRNRIFLSNKNEESPIFVQFLDAVQNIVQQFPNCFQFNLNFIRDFALVSYFGVFSNFIGNNEREREQMKLEKYAIHAFDFFNFKKEVYVNWNFDSKNQLGKLKLNEVNLKFWKEYFFMYFEPDQDCIEIPVI